MRACVRDEIDAIATDMLRLWWACLDEFSAAGVGDESVRPLTDALVALLHAGAEFRGLGRLRFKDPGGLRARLLGRTPKHSGLASWLAESLRRKYVRRESNGPFVFGARLLGRALTGRSAPAQFYDRACDAVAALGEGLRGEPRLAAALREQYGRDAIFPTSRAIASLEPDGEFAAWRSVRRGAEEGGAPEPTTPATDACVPGSPMNFFKASYSGWALDELSKGFVGHNVEQAVRWRAFDREELPGVIAALTAAVRRPSWPRNDSFWALRSLVALGGEAVQPQVLRALAELARGLTDDERSFPGVFPIRSGPREFLALPRMLLTALKPMKIPEAIRTAVADAAAARPHAPAEPGTNGDGFHGIRSFAGRCWNFAVHEDNHHALLLRFVEAAGPEIDREARGTAPSADAATLRQRVLADLIGDHAALFRAEAAMAATRLPSLLENPKVVDAIIEVDLPPLNESSRDERIAAEREGSRPCRGTVTSPSRSSPSCARSRSSWRRARRSRRRARRSR
ncbi:MAG: hypothetical protein AVDCRST_MAG13-2689 [uncultured Solirubrobacteraceae bacterium]|uniref:Uncharacterized protein n=1 Tax=uncultured Solirubrobacteraceae bacterium TaxID=1162706 RepID=A0A6J4SY16_9ACTN|nr:MAG: hypothetical protein AVDCRST_MAG13-2689 [uncultured Solirubrobacteraceae bacterium]